MSPANRTAKEIAAVRRAMLLGKLTPEDGAARIKALEARGAVYVARWELPNGAERTRSFKGKGAEKRAMEYELEQKGKVRRREHEDHHALRVTVAEVLAFYLAKLEGRESFKNVRAHIRDIVEVWGDRLTLERLDRDPDTLIGELREKLEAKHDEKTAWNRKVTGQAAINYYTRKKRLRLLNPFMSFDWPQPESKRTQCPTPDDYQDLMRAAELSPWWAGLLITLGRHHALRMGEFLSWRWEWSHLEPDEGSRYPWVKTLKEKQGGKKKVYREIPLYKPAAEALKAAPVANKEVGLIIPRSRSAVDKMIRIIYNRAGKQHLTFHDWRRLFDREHPELSQRERMELLGQETEKANSHYRTQLERRKMESLVAESYQ